MNVHKRHSGFTLVELMFTVALVAILLGFAVPALRDMYLRNQLNKATNDLYQFLMEARSLSIRENQDVYMNFRSLTGGNQCFGYKLGGPCSCTTAGSCDKTISNNSYDSISYRVFSGSEFIPTFSPDGWSGNSWRIEIRGTGVTTTILKNITINSTNLVFRYQ